MEILAAVIARLAGLGYTVTASDHGVIRREIKKAKAALMAKTNQITIPDGLYYVWVDMAAGSFLRGKKDAGALSSVYDFDAPAKRISEGDTTVEFAMAEGSTFEAQFDAALAKMMNPDMDLIYRYRRMVW